MRKYSLKIIIGNKKQKIKNLECKIKYFINKYREYLKLLNIIIMTINIKNNNLI